MCVCVCVCMCVCVNQLNYIANSACPRVCVWAGVGLSSLSACVCVCACVSVCVCQYIVCV